MVAGNGGSGRPRAQQLRAGAPCQHFLQIWSAPLGGVRNADEQRAAADGPRGGTCGPLGG